MTSTYDSTGLNVDRYADVLARLIALATAWKGESLSTDEEEYLGHVFRQESLLSAEANEIIQAIYDTLGVRNNQSVPLDNILEVIGLYRQAAAKSTVTLTLTVDRAVTIPAGKIVQTAAKVQWVTDEDLVFAGAGSDTVAATCTVTGPNNAAAGEINEIVTPVGGWTAVTNAAAAIPGRNRELDAELKVRHTAAVATSGERDAASIYEAVAAVTGVDAVAVVEDYTSDTPVHVYVIGGADEDIAAAIDNTITAGIGLAGTTSVVVYNATIKTNKTIKFTRATDLDTYVSVTVLTNPALYPSDGDDQIKANIVAIYDGQGIGENVVYWELPGAVYDVEGATMTALYLDTVSPPTGTSDIVVAQDKRAVITAANITIVHA